MKKFVGVLAVLSVMTLTPTFAQTISTGTVVDFLFENGMTKFETVVDFRANDFITRGESAKFVGEYAVAIDFDASYAGSCTFSDIANYDNTLTPHIDTVCRLGLIKGSQGMYMPNNTLTEAEALTILARSQTGFEDETGARWYEGYFQKAVALGLVSNSEIDTVATTPITRGRLGLWIYMIMNQDMMNTDMNDDDTTLEGILNDIFGDDMLEDDTTVSSSSPAPARTVGATMNVYEEGQTRHDGFQPFTKSQLQNALNADMNVVLYFSADRCPNCKLLTSSLEAHQFAFPDDVLVLMIDFDEQTDLVTQYGVTSQHTLVFLDSEGNTVKKETGTIYTLADIEAEIATL